MLENLRKNLIKKHEFLPVLLYTSIANAERLLY